MEFCTCIRPDLIGDMVRCCFLERAAAAVDAALQCIIQMSASSDLQVSCLLQNQDKTDKS